MTWNDKPVAFIGLLEFPGMPRKSKRISRIVVLPDFQGLGIGAHLVDYMAQLYKSIEYDVYIRTINPALGESMKKNKGWKSTGKGNTNTNDKYKKVLNRPSYGFKYIGEKSQDCTDILRFNASAFKDVSQNQIRLF